MDRFRLRERRERELKNGEAAYFYAVIRKSEGVGGRRRDENHSLCITRISFSLFPFAVEATEQFIQLPGRLLSLCSILSG